MRKKLLTYVKPETYFTLVILKMKFGVNSIGEVIDRLLEEVTREYISILFKKVEIKEMLEELSKGEGDEE